MRWSMKCLNQITNGFLVWVVAILARGHGKFWGLGFPLVTFVAWWNVFSFFSPDELNSRDLLGSHENEQDSLSCAGEDGRKIIDVVEVMEIDHPLNDPLALEI